MNYISRLGLLEFTRVFKMKLHSITFSDSWQIEWHNFTEDYTCIVCDAIEKETLLLI